MSSNFGKIRQRTAELAALERMEKSLYTYNGRCVVAALALSGKIRQRTAELAALERMEKS